MAGVAADILKDVEAAQLRTDLALRRTLGLDLLTELSVGQQEIEGPPSRT